MSVNSDSPIRTSFAFLTDWWEDADVLYTTEHEKFIFLKTIMDYGARGIIPPNCDSREHIKTTEDRIRWSALKHCIEFIDGHDKYIARGRKGGRGHKNGCSDSSDETSTSDIGSEFNDNVAIASIQSPIDQGANIRCNSIGELKAWFKRFSDNARPIRLANFKDTDKDWMDLYEYLNNNDWKYHRGKDLIVWGNFTPAVRWAWTSIREKRLAKGETDESDSMTMRNDPGESLRKDDALQSKIERTFGSKKH